MSDLEAAFWGTVAGLLLAGFLSLIVNKYV